MIFVNEFKLKKLILQPSERIAYSVKRSVIHLIFSHEQEVVFSMGPGMEMRLAKHSNYLFYEQDRDFQFELYAIEPSFIIALEIPIEALHGIMAKGTDDLNFRATDVLEKERYHKLNSNAPEVIEAIEQCIALDNLLLIEAKKYELLSHYFVQKDVQTYKCPFLNQKENVEKVRMAKKLLLNDLQNSPTIKELAKEVGMNEHNLKSGFKEIYAKPIHSFLKDHKMMTARELIDSREFKVNEIAEQLGYSNVSHFIEAFKKKFGLTPKQYELNSMGS